VKLYGTSDCTGTVAGQGSASSFASSGIRVSVSDNSTTTYHATATDAVGNTSGCSTTSVSYTEDSTLVGVPEITASTPASPANQNSPLIKGTAQAGTTVKLYTDAGCAGPVAGQGTAAQFAGSGISITVADDSATTLFAAATNATSNTSPCSSPGFTYVEDSSPPAPPTLSGSSPLSPGDDNDPAIAGTAEDGSTVSLYTNASCTSASAGQGTAAQLANPGITVHVADATSTTLFATATDAAGNTSACSDSSVTYIESTATPLGGEVSSAQTGQPIPGATVALLRSDSAGGPFKEVPGSGATTDSGGHYGWELITGFYRVSASAPGCASRDSQVVEIPPAVSGLDLVLDCPSAPAGGGPAVGPAAAGKQKCRKAKKRRHRASAARAHCKKKRKKRGG
jgi:hypothetical protein